MYKIHFHRIFSVLSSVFYDCQLEFTVTEVAQLAGTVYV